MAWLFRSISALVLVATLFVPNVRAQMFVGREVNPAAKPGDVPLKVQDIYTFIKSRRSLLVPLCIQDQEICPSQFQQDYSLSSQFAIGAQLTNLSLQTIRSRWFDEATTDKPKRQAPLQNTGLKPENAFESFRLLAIVNRMDLADWVPGPAGKGGKWQGAELRFIYGLKQPPGAKPRLTLIVEFLLPDMDWKEFWNQADRWRSLSPVAPSELATALARVLELSSYRNASTIRVRTNCQVIGARWRFAEWDFHTAPAGFGPVDLEFQVNTSFTRPTPAAGPGIAPHIASERYNKYASFWMTARSDGSKPVPIPSDLTTKTADYLFTQRGPFLGPPSTLANSDGLQFVRNVIAMQQCTECHALETWTPLQHVSDTGGISSFLVPHRNWDPSLAAIALPANSPGSATFTVPVWYCVPSTPGVVSAANPALQCPNGTPIQKPRSFHDLARRKLFLASVLAVDAAGPEPDDIRNIAYYATDFAH